MFKNIIGMSIFWCIIYNIGANYPESNALLLFGSFILVFLYSIVLGEIYYPAYVSGAENSRGLMQLIILIISVLMGAVCFWKLGLDMELLTKTPH